MLFIFTFLRKYIVKCNIDLEHNHVLIGVGRAEFMNPLHNSFNWIFQISHPTQIINTYCWKKLASELLGPSFFNFVVISKYRRGGYLWCCGFTSRIYAQSKPDCSLKVTFFRMLSKTFVRLKRRAVSASERCSLALKNDIVLTTVA